MRTIGNILWFLLGGAAMGLLWWAFGLLAFISIIGIPWGRACFVMGRFSFFPFGYEAVPRNHVFREQDIGTGTLGFIGNVIWFLFAGLWLAIGHLVSAVACFCDDYRYPIRAPAPKIGHHFTSANWQNGDLEKRSRMDEILNSISVSNLPQYTKAA